MVRLWRCAGDAHDDTRYRTSLKRCHTKAGSHATSRSPMGVVPCSLLAFPSNCLFQVAQYTYFCNFNTPHVDLMLSHILQGGKLLSTRFAEQAFIFTSTVAPPQRPPTSRQPQRISRWRPFRHLLWPPRPTVAPAAPIHPT